MCQGQVELRVIIFRENKKRLANLSRTVDTTVEAMEVCVEVTLKKKSRGEMQRYSRLIGKLFPSQLFSLTPSRSQPD